MKRMNKIMTLTALLLIGGQAVCSSGRAYDPYAQYGMPAEAVGPAGVSFVEKSKPARPVASKATNLSTYDPYAQYGIPEEAVGLQEEPVVRRGKTHKQPARRNSYTPRVRQSGGYVPVDAELLD